MLLKTFFLVVAAFNIILLTADIINDLPTVQDCAVGRRFVVNHILFVCHQFGERRSFRPFGIDYSNLSCVYF